MTKPVIGFVGLTHLGLNSALASAAKGFQTIGWDDAPGLVDRLNAAVIPINEPDFDDLFAANRTRLQFTADMSGLSSCDVIYVAIDVPTDDEGNSDLTPVADLLDRLAAHASPSSTIVILSQVAPGFSRSMQAKFPVLVYQVETLVFGRAVERAMKPERFIVGLADPSTGLPAAMDTFLRSFDCPLLPMRYESAELCKIAINCFLVASVSTTNALSNVCEKIGAEWNEIAPALRLDARIGPYAYLKPGLGISGGNLERDLKNVVDMADAAGVDAGPIQEYRRFSVHSKDWVKDRLNEAFGNAPVDKTIGVLGLAYKENTHSTKNSPALRLIEGLGGYNTRVFDPVVSGSVAPGCIPTDGIEACVEGCDAVCIMTPWDAFKDLDMVMLAERMAGKLLIDPYGLVDRSDSSRAGFTHLVRGVPQN